MADLARLGRLALVLLSLGAAAPSTGAPEPAPLEVGRGERLLVVAPHPDDESIGAAGLVQRVIERGGSARILIVTAGDGYVEAVVHETGKLRPRPADFIAYGEQRIREARAAVRELASERVRVQFLGFPDGGLEELLHAHWRRDHPERSKTTGVADPPYPDVVDGGLAYDGADLRRELVELLRDARPTIVALPEPIDVHPDHAATGLFTLLAIDGWAGPRATARAPMPRLLTYLVHWPAWPGGWNAPQPPGPDTPLALPAELPEPVLPRALLELADAERAGKSRALARHASQQEVMGSFLASFVRRTEPFRVLGERDLERTTAAIERSIERGARAGARTAGPAR
jgi:LmbE family N-acetylglucosaminyl deacetylase